MNISAWFCCTAQVVSLSDTVVYFFCRHDEAAKSEPVNLLRTLAHQLSGKLPWYECLYSSELLFYTPHIALSVCHGQPRPSLAHRNREPKLLLYEPKVSLFLYFVLINQV